MTRSSDLRVMVSGVETMSDACAKVMVQKWTSSKPTAEHLVSLFTITLINARMAELKITG